MRLGCPLWQLYLKYVTNIPTTAPDAQADEHDGAVLVSCTSASRVHIV